MEHLNPLISDLALILVVAGITSLLFKWMKQPVVLGYIVAGFLAGPNFVFFPTIADPADINIWANIGIIVLLFSLGLEFSFRKLLHVGGSAFITASVIVWGMMLLGYATGRLLHFSYLDSLFLGGMLSMSSTTIIIKAFTDLNLRKQKFTTLVFGVLIVEDMFAVLMMVLLSSIAVNHDLEGKELLFSVLKLAFFLIMWFLIGIFMLPTILKKARRFLNSETLLIVSMGLCLGMVVLASYAGFSAALGAFVMGSILAGTNEAERIGKVIQPVKDLFGAVFFISVGMLVSPEALVQYAIPILILSAVVVMGQIFFGTSGMLISGQSLQVAVKSGFSLAQIGEFAFIIAALGMSLKVIDSFLYPIVVAVSVVTTFTTPYFIKMADPVYRWLEKHMPERFHLVLTRYSTNAATIQTTNTWKKVVGMYLSKIALYATLLIALIILSKGWFIPFMNDRISSIWGTHLAVAVSLIVMSPFLWGLSMKRVQRDLIEQLKREERGNQMPLIIMIIFRILLGLVFVAYFLSGIYSHRIGVTMVISAFVLLLILFSKKVQRQITRIEDVFINNLNERELRRTGKKNNLIRDMHLAHMEVSVDCPFVGKRLRDANIRKEYGVNVVSIKRGTRRMNIPGGESRLFPGDEVSVVGTDNQIQKFLAAVEPHESEDTEKEAVKVSFEGLPVTADSYLVGKTVGDSGIRDKESCLLVGIERKNGTFVQPTGQTIFESGDLLWIVGEKDKIGKILTGPVLAD